MDEVIPLSKVGNPASTVDLRPISLLSLISKIFEKLTAQQIHDYVQASDILPKHQSKLRKFNSTTTTLPKILDDIRNASHLSLKN